MGGVPRQGDTLDDRPFTDQSGALAIFTTRVAAEEFAADDPFVLNGVVKEWRIREWREALASS
ncbi:MAG: hypothetical protein M3Z98_04145 [Candidatus Dormibacteraeota bacterium]|nr:hypothetical protein [Candidatus Dormibacteraeota bacterium]